MRVVDEVKLGAVRVEAVHLRAEHTRELVHVDVEERAPGLPLCGARPAGSSARSRG